MKEGERVVASQGKYDDTLFNDFSRKQVEMKYGGDVEDIEQFWYFLRFMLKAAEGGCVPKRFDEPHFN
jgi:hypothetical protein